MASFSNQATLSYNGTVVSSNVVTGQIVSALSVTKTAVGSTYTPEGKIVYVVNVVNSGSASFEGLTLTDDLGGPVGSGMPAPLRYEEGTLLYFVNGNPQPAPAVSAEDGLQITGIDVPAGGSAALVYQTAVTADAPLEAGSEIVNAIALTGEGVGTPVTAEASVPVEEAAALSVSKSLSPDTVRENGRLTYTFVIRNTGNAAADEAAGTALQDLFDPALTELSVTFNGRSWTEGEDYTYDEAAGLFATVPGRITVPAASYPQSPDGSRSVAPGEAVLTVSGTV